MILIISHNSMDYPTEAVFDWIRNLGYDCQRINGSDLINDFNFGIYVNSDSTLSGFNSEKLNLSDVSAVWIRRWTTYERFENSYTESDKSVAGDREFALVAGRLRKYLLNEFRLLSNYFFELIKDKPSLGNPFYEAKDPNKAQQLLLAAKAGLKIPDTLITDRKEILITFVEKHSAVICKNISELGFFNYKEETYGTYTTLVDNDLIEKLEDRFYPSLFQEAIEKEFEIRSFYLDGQVYSMAIFSSKDSQTAVDFRRFKFENPNRNVPYQLPTEINDKIIVFMETCGLTTGSLDLIRSVQGEYYFLEVNPIGQFSMVSSPCNYNLEKKVAEYLINLGKND